VLDNRLRGKVERFTEPVGRFLVRLGFSANKLTVTGLAINCVASAVVATGRFGLALAIGAVGTILDMLDGAVAKAGQTMSRRGSFLDSVADRLSEVAMFSGLAWHLRTSRPDLVYLCLLSLGFSLVISYERAKAESLGLEGKGGLFERGERLIVLGIGVGIPGALAPALWVMTAGTAFTVAQRFFAILAQSEPPPTPVGIEPYRISVAEIRRRSASMRARYRERRRVDKKPRMRAIRPLQRRSGKGR
jgi:CDP-diacylglycerol--glycerol-3-phosphate 3-phosphatidyltransferase